MIQHKPWPIQTITDCKDSCRLSRQLQTVETVAHSHNSCRQLQTIVDMLVPVPHQTYQNLDIYGEKSRIRETLNLSTYADNRTNTDTDTFVLEGGGI